MTRSILLGLLFVLSALFQVSFIQTLPDPFRFFPLHLLIGIVILHRSGDVPGALWLLASAVVMPRLEYTLLSAWSYVLVAALGILLTRRVFTKRSVYGLVGLGTLLYLLIISIHAVLTWLHVETTYMPFRFSVLLLVLFGLYGGFLIAKLVEQRFSNRFLIRSKNHGQI